MKKVLYLLVFVSFLFTAFAENDLPDFLLDNQQVETKFTGDRPYYHDHSNCSHKYHDKFLSKPETSQINYRPYDVLKYDLYLDWFDIMDKNGPEKELYTQYGGIIKMDVRIDSANTDFIEVDAGEFTINSVKINDVELEETFEVKDFILQIPVQTEVGDELSVEIDYTYNGKGRAGVYIYPEGYPTYDWWLRDTLYNHHNIAYTQSEPSDARLWFPCNDRPYDKAQYEISIRVPEGYAAPSNGVLEDIEELDDALIYHWKGTLPISTYLMVANASKYALFQEDYVVNDTKTIPIMNYIWEEDELGVDTLIIGNEAFKNTAAMLDLYSDMFNEYPYEKYGHAAVYPYRFGGMEHNTMTTVHRNWLRGYSEIGIAHEVAHHWIGDMISCATWNDLWINEGGASWGEALWMGEIGGETAYSNHMFNHYYSYYREILEDRQYAYHPIYGVPEMHLFSQGARLIYQKSAWIYHMLYEWSGRQPFVDALNKLFEEYYFQSIETSDFERVMKEELVDFPIPIETFFEQYLYSGGMPFINLSGKTEQSEDQKYDIEVKIDQIQDQEGVPEVFEFMMQIVFMKMDGDDLIESEYTEMFLNDQRSMTKTFQLDFAPDTMTVSRRKLLCLPVNSTLELLTSVDDNIQLTEIKSYPTPVSSGLPFNIEYESQGIGGDEVIITDEIGKVVYRSSKNANYNGTYIFQIPTDNLSSGVYFGRVISGNNIYQFRMPVVN